MHSEEPPDPNRKSVEGSRINLPAGLIEEPGFAAAVAELGIDIKQLDWALMMIDEVKQRDLLAFTLETHRVDIRAFRVEPWTFPPLLIYLRGEADGIHLISARWADDFYPI